MKTASRSTVTMFLLGAFVFAALGGCEGGPTLMGTSSGKDGEIVVVTDSTLADGPVGEAFKEVFEQRIFTIPNPEKEFNVTFITGSGGIMERTVRRNKAIVFVSTGAPGSYAGSVIAEELTAEEKSKLAAGEQFMFKRKDRWARYQNVLFLQAPTPEAIVSVLKTAADELRKTYNLLDRERLERDMFAEARQDEKEVEMMRKHNFSVNFQHDYFYAADTTGLVWIRRQPLESRREFIIRYFDNADPGVLNKEWIIDRRNEVVSQIRSMDDSAFVNTYVSEDNPQRLVTTPVNFLGREGFETRGLWQMVVRDERGVLLPLEGGPFINFTFFDPVQRRIYMIDGMVFAPRFDKREFLRQMETIAYTFRTVQDVQAARAN